MEENTTDKLKSRLAQWQTYVSQTADNPTVPAAAEAAAETQEVRVEEAAEPEFVPRVPTQSPQASPRESWSAETQRVAHSFTAANSSAGSAAMPDVESGPKNSVTHPDETVSHERAAKLFVDSTSVNRPGANQRNRIKVEVTPQRRRDLMAAIWMCAAILVLVLTILLTNQYRG